MTKTPPGHLTPDQAAEFLGVTRRSVDNYIRQGLVRAYRGFGGRTYLKMDDVAALLVADPVETENPRRPGRPLKVRPVNGG